MIKYFIRFILSFKMLTPIKHFLKQLHNFKLLAKDYGQYRTIRDQLSVDENGQPVPWYTYPAIEFLFHLDLSQFTVFEYGSGNSTLYWAKRVKQITSVESDENWYKYIKKNAKTSNIILKLEKNRKKYISIANNSFDFFVIDGIYRKECVEHILKLKKIGQDGIMIILDNSDRYENLCVAIQKKLKWIQIDFHGFGPINNYSWSTSIFLNPVTYHKITYIRALKSKCGLV